MKKRYSIPKEQCTCGISEFYDNVAKIIDVYKRQCFDCPHFNNDNFHMDCDLDYDISDIVMKHAMNPPEN